MGSPLTIFLILTAFSNGCTAMTGVEAVSNGVPAFRPPESRNAAATMVTMAVLSITMFLGITLLARAYQVMPSEQETVISQIARGVFEGRGLPYYLVQAATISNGIIGLSFFASLLLVIFAGDTHALIPLYMIGVFVSFTFSQAGMVMHWKRLRGAGWKTSALVSGFGALVTGIVLVVVAVTKAHEGAWIIMVLIPVHVFFFKMTHRHYNSVADQLTLRGFSVPEETPHVNRVLIPVSGVHRAVVRALTYAKTLSSDVRAVYVNLDSVATEQMKREWITWGQGVPLVVLESPYRSLMEPLLEYVEHIESEHPEDYVTVVLPEFVPKHWWQHLFHNQRALLIKGAFLFKPNTVVTSVPFHLTR